jgi:hypothetical protein
MLLLNRGRDRVEKKEREQRIARKIENVLKTANSGK